MRITAQANVQVPLERTRQWFIELESHPERYQFDTHAGFVFTSGTFGEVGARFQTRENFCGLPLTLGFELTEVGETWFSFCLIRPMLPVRGMFSLEQALDDTTDLALIVTTTARPTAWFLRLPLVRGAVQRQIRREIAHIKSSIETTFSSLWP